MSVPTDAGSRAGAGGRPGVAEFRLTLLRLSQVATVGAFALVAVAGALSTWWDGGVHVEALPFTAWGGAASVVALVLATLAGDDYATAVPRTRRRAWCAALAVLLLVAVTGAVTAAGGVAGPAWVLLLPVVLLVGGVAGPVAGLAFGAGAAASVYAAAALTGTLTSTGLARLVIVLPALPTVAWAAGALGAAARDAAVRAERDRVRLRDEVDSLAAQLAAFAAGDLTVTPSLARGAEPVTTALAVTTSDAVVALRRLVRSLDATVAALATAAAPLAGRADEEAAASGDQGEAVGTTTSTVEQLAGAAAMIAELALRVAQCAGGTRQHVDVAATTVGAAAASVERIDTRVAGVDRRVRRLAESVADVGAAAAVIDDLARRTEILAVNASIEAARAGEHGDGFRTVAGEVASHAARARVATASIDAIVAELRAAVRDIADVNAQAREAVAVGVAVQDDVGRALNRITAMVDATIVAATRITGATRQQRADADAVVRAMATLTETGERHSTGAARHAAAAARLRDLAESCAATLGGFKVR